MAASTLCIHPENPRYLSFRGKPIVLITSAEHYGAVINLDFDYRLYLDTLHAEDMNHTRVFAGVYREYANLHWQENVLAPAPDRFVCPYPRSGTPGALDGGMKFDLAAWDPVFFERLRDFCARAGEHGIVVEINLFCPYYSNGGKNLDLWQLSPWHPANHVNDLGDFGVTEAFSVANERLLACQRRMVEKICTELNAFDHVYYEVCNEPYADRLPLDWQRCITEVITETEQALPQRHLVSWNVSNYWCDITDPHPGVSIFNFHYARPADTVAMNYGLGRVIGCNETGFDGDEESEYRFQAWDFILAGGGLFNNLDPSFTCTDPAGRRRNTGSPDWAGSPELRRQYRILSAFIHSFDLGRMQPVDGILRSACPGDVARVLGREGTQYAGYLRSLYPTPRFPPPHRTVALNLPEGTYELEWIHPDTGRREERVMVHSAGSLLELNLPKFRNDLAVRIVRAEQ